MDGESSNSANRPSGPGASAVFVKSSSNSSRRVVTSTDQSPTDVPFLDKYASRRPSGNQIGLRSAVSSDVTWTGSRPSIAITHTLGSSPCRVDTYATFEPSGEMTGTEFLRLVSFVSGLG